MAPGHAHISTGVDAAATTRYGGGIGETASPVAAVSELRRVQTTPQALQDILGEEAAGSCCGHWSSSSSTTPRDRRSPVQQPAVGNGMRTPGSSAVFAVSGVLDDPIVDDDDDTAAAECERGGCLGLLSPAERRRRQQRQQQHQRQYGMSADDAPSRVHSGEGAARIQRRNLILIFALAGIVGALLIAAIVVIGVVVVKAVKHGRADPATPTMPPLDARRRYADTDDRNSRPTSHHATPSAQVRGGSKEDGVGDTDDRYQPPRQQRPQSQPQWPVEGDDDPDITAAADAVADDTDDTDGPAATPRPRQSPTTGTRKQQQQQPRKKQQYQAALPDIAAVHLQTPVSFCAPTIPVRAIVHRCSTTGGSDLATPASATDGLTIGMIDLEWARDGGSDHIGPWTDGVGVAGAVERAFLAMTPTPTPLPAALAEWSPARTVPCAVGVTAPTLSCVFETAALGGSVGSAGRPVVDAVRNSCVDAGCICNALSHAMTMATATTAASPVASSPPPPPAATDSLALTYTIGEDARTGDTRLVLSLAIPNATVRAVSATMLDSYVVDMVSRCWFCGSTPLICRRQH